MRPIDRILSRTATPAPSYAVRPFGSTPADAAATDATAADAAGSSGTKPNLTSGEQRVAARFNPGTNGDF